METLKNYAARINGQVRHYVGILGGYLAFGQEVLTDIPALVQDVTGWVMMIAAAIASFADKAKKVGAGDPEKAE